MKDHPAPRSAPADQPSGPRILIIGGGASGVLMAAHLLSGEHGVRVTIVEGRHMLGCGVAYSTTDPDHLLNTRVRNMSAFADDPDHFRDWLRARPDGARVTGQSFVSRATYGRYLSEVLRPWSAPPASPALRCVRQTCIRIHETARGVVATLADGRILAGDMAVLATGHVQPNGDPNGALSRPWETLGDVPADSRIVIVGSGLTMVDTVLSLLNTGHRGQILAISRHGQLPRGHKPTTPLAIAAKSIPGGVPMSALLAWVRRLAREAERQGGTWRDAIDGIRPHVRSIWRELSLEERARFLRHAATWWDVHRHRIPPDSERSIQVALSSSRLVVSAATFLAASIEPDGSRNVSLRPAGGHPVHLTASRVIDCRGIRQDPENHATPLVADLLATGSARVDALRISLDVTLDSRLVGRSGVASRRLFAIGPPTRSAFWEITAIPDIRDQAARLAADLVRPRD